MNIVILFEDNPEADSDIREKFMADHLVFLEENKNIIETAGPLLNHSGDTSSGLWLLNTNDFSLAEKLVRTDPFWPTGLRKSFKIMQWKKVFAYGQRQITP